MFLVLWVFSMVACAMIAGRYQRSVGAWVVLGLLFGVFAVAAVLIMGPANGATTPLSQGVANLVTPVAAAPTRICCPQCGESIAASAVVCRFCGLKLKEN